MDDNSKFWKLILETLEKIYNEKSFIRASIKNDLHDHGCCDFLMSKKIKNKIVVFDSKVLFFIDETLFFSITYDYGLFFPLDRVYIKIWLNNSENHDFLESESYWNSLKIKNIMDKLFKIKPNEEYNNNINTKDVIIDIINKLVDN